MPMSAFKERIALSVNLRSQIAVSLLAVVVGAGVARAQGPGGEVQGSVRNAAGEPMPGAVVKVRNVDQGFAFMVATQDQGLYEVSQLPSGRYSVQGFGGNWKSAVKAPVAVTNGQTVTVEVALTNPLGVDELTTAQYSALMPDGLGKTLIRANCIGCHGFEKIAVKRQSGEAWMQIVEAMRNRPFGHTGSARITDPERDVIVEYLTKNLGPDVPPLNPDHDLPKTWLKGAARKYIAMDFEIPRGAYPHDVAVDSKGIAWVTEGFTGYLGRLDPSTLTYTRIALPAIQPKPKTFHLFAAAVDARDHIWLTDESNDRVVEYDQKSGTFTQYPLPEVDTPGRHGANTIRFGPDGSVWMTQVYGGILRLRPNAKEFETYTPPGGKAYPYGMAIDSDGDVWFAENSRGKFGKLDPATGNFTEYAVPTPENLRGMTVKNSLAGEIHNLRRMASDAKGDIWYAGFGLDTLGVIDHRTGRFTEYIPPTPFSGPYSVDVDTRHNLIWFIEGLAEQMGLFDPRTKTFVEFPMPNAPSMEAPERKLSVQARDPEVEERLRTRAVFDGSKWRRSEPYTRRVEVDPGRPNRVWYSSAEGDTVGYVETIE